MPEMLILPDRGKKLSLLDINHPFQALPRSSGWCDAWTTEKSPDVEWFMIPRGMAL
jgi:hypothetical protein